MTNTLISFLLFWAIWLLVPLFIDGVTAVAYLLGASTQIKVRNRRHAYKMTHYPIVTIIIPVHNGAHFLHQCIESLRNQSYPQDKLEVFVVDNRSIDGAFAIFSEEQSKPFRGRLEWISIQQRGKALALNAGIHVSSGEIIACIDCDVVLHRDAILSMAKAFSIDPELAAATGTIEILPWEKEGHGLRHIMAECEYMEYFSSFNVGRQYQTATGSLFTLAGAFSVFRRDILLRTFMYDKQTVSEDTKLTFELHKMFKNLKKACISEAIAFTEATPSFSALYSQRVRWQRGQLEVAALFPDEVHSPLKLTGLASAKSLLVDHTLAFTRIIWTFLLPMLYFIGYPLTMVVTATIVMYICYMLIEGITIMVDYIVAEKDSKPRIRRDWWLFTVMPAYRFLLFWLRLGGFVSVLMDSSEWKAEDPGKQVSAALSNLRLGTRSKKNDNQQSNG